MRKLLFILGITFILYSCTLSYPDNTILTNYSNDQTITIKLIGINDIVLLPGQSTSIETITSVHSSKRMQSYDPSNKIYYVYTSLSFSFYDRESYEIRLLNLSGKSGKLNSTFMDTINFSSSNSEQFNTSWLLYNTNPKFTAITDDGFPLSVNFLFDSNVFKITIN